MRRLSPLACAAAAILLTAVDASAAYKAVLLRKHVGANPRELLGYAGAALGDVNRDGYPDYLVGEPDAATENGLNTGRAVVFSGKTGAVTRSHSGLYPFIPRCPECPSRPGRFGAAVASAGDIDRDGADDYIVGEPRAAERPDPSVVYMIHGESPGHAYVYSGADGRLLHTLTGDAVTVIGDGNVPDAFGYAVAGPGDMNGDGIPDLLVGAPSALPSNTQPSYTLGRTRLYSGADGSELLSRAGEYWDNGVLTGSAFHGAALAVRRGRPAFTGDADYLVGSPGQLPDGLWPPEYVGRVEAYHDTQPALAFERHLPYVIDDLLGFSVAFAGDQDGDGPSDVAAGAPLAAGGSVWVFRSSGAPVQADFGPAGVEDRALFGWSLASMPDWDGDGRREIVAGAPAADVVGGYDAGLVRIFSVGAPEALLEIPGEHEGANFGLSVAPLGDVNKDGAQDLLIGEASGQLEVVRWQGGAATDGAAYVYSLCKDADLDGYYAEGGVCGPRDCNDGNARVNPGAREDPNTVVDDNCNGSPLCGAVPAAASGSQAGGIALYAALLLLHAAFRALRRR